MRLKKADSEIKNVNDAKDLLNRINKSCENIKDDYYILLDNLNAIYSSYPNLYNELKQVVKLPNDKDIKNVVDLNNSMESMINQYLSNNEFLQNIIEREKTTN